MAAPPTIFGKVVDASTGAPIPRCRAIRVKAFRPDFYSTDFQASSVTEGKNGQYTLTIKSNSRQGNRYRVRIEADGYRTALGQKDMAVGDPPLEEDFRLEPKPAWIGIVQDASGNPVDSFRVAVGSPTSAPHFNLDENSVSIRPVRSIYRGPSSRISTVGCLHITITLSNSVRTVDFRFMESSLESMNW